MKVVLLLSILAHGKTLALPRSMPDLDACWKEARRVMDGEALKELKRFHHDQVAVGCAVQSF